MEENQKLIESIPNSSMEILRNSFICYKAYFRSFITLSLFTTAPYLILHFIISFFSDEVVTQELLSNLIILQSFDLLREGYLDVIILLALVSIFTEKTINPKEILSEFLTKYFSRSTLIIFIYLLISFSITILDIFGYVLVLLVVFANLSAVVLHKNWSIFKAGKLSIRSVFQNFFLSLYLLFVMVIIAKFPEIIAVVNFIDQSMIQGLESQQLSLNDLLSIFNHTYLHNHNFIIVSSLIKLFVQPLKSIIFAFLFLYLLKRYNIELINDFFSSQSKK